MTITRMQEPRQMYQQGGIMQVAPRQGYFLGKLVKSIGKGVKKIVKSPIGKAALIGAAAFGIPGTQFGGLLGRAAFGGAAPSIFGKAGGIQALLPSVFGTPGVPDTIGKQGFFQGLKSKFGGLSTGAKFGIGAGITSLLAASGMGEEEIETTKRDPDKLKIYLKDYFSKVNPNASDAEVEEFVKTNISEYMAEGGRVGFKEGMNMKMASMDENEREFMRLVEEFMERGFSQQEAIEEARDTLERKSIATGGRVGLMGGAMPTGIIRTNEAGTMERDYRETGGFVPVGIKEKADDVPAMLSKNEFVMTADAVRGMGDGSIEKGAQKLYDQMKRLENKVA